MLLTFVCVIVYTGTLKGQILGSYYGRSRLLVNKGIIGDLRAFFLGFEETYRTFYKDKKRIT